MMFEPFRIKMVEPVESTTRPEREEWLAQAGYNLFKIPARKVLIDLLTDSGTGAMSQAQWSRLMLGDESYAGAESFYVFEKAVRDLTGLPHVLPVHQGRAAEKILASLLIREGTIIPGNTHFDTTQANIEFAGGKALHLPMDKAAQPETYHPFKGNIHLGKLEEVLTREKGKKSIPFCLLTLTNNSVGGQPVSLKNIREARDLLQRFSIPLFFDAARFAENAYLIKEREPGYERASVRDIVREMFSCADGVLCSAKKNGLVNIGGFLAVRDHELYQALCHRLVLYEGFPTYGGLAGRDLEALAQGLQEVLQEDYLTYRIGQVRFLWERLKSVGVPLVNPPGGHAVFVNASRLFEHIPAAQFPGQVMACALYLEGGIRSTEVGGVMFSERLEGPGSGTPDLLRLAIPSRVYTQSHLEYISDVFATVVEKRKTWKGLRIIENSPFLRHFTCSFEWLDRSEL